MSGLYYVKDRLSNEYLTNDDGKKIQLSEVTKKTYDLLKEEFDLLENVVLEKVPVPDDLNSILTYQGGTNLND